MLMTVKKLWPLDPEKDSGGFANIDGVSAYVELDAYHMLSEGMRFEAPAKKMVSKTSGKPYYRLPDGWRPPNTVGAIIPGGQRAPNGHASQAPPRQAGNGSTYSTPKQMFIMGVVGRALGSGKFGADDIRQLTAMAADAWEAHGG